MFKNLYLAILINYASIFDKSTDCAQADNKSMPLRKKFESKIYFGVDSTIEQFPSFAGLFVKDNYGSADFECGGAIITDRMVITAGHCVYYSQNHKRYSIKTGSSFRIGNGGKFYDLKKIILHNKFNSLSLDNDFALLKTRHEIIFNDYVQSVPFIKYPVNDDAAMLVVGWGETETGNLAEQLKRAVVYKINENECKRAMPRVTITNSMFCAKDHNKINRSDTCIGDSGGPVYYNNRLVGLTSWAPINTCSVGQTEPAVYADILSASDWIWLNI